MRVTRGSLPGLIISIDNITINLIKKDISSLVIVSTNYSKRSLVIP